MPASGMTVDWYRLCVMADDWKAVSGNALLFADRHDLRYPNYSDYFDPAAVISAMSRRGHNEPAYIQFIVPLSGNYATPYHFPKIAIPVSTLPQTSVTKVVVTVKCDMAAGDEEYQPYRYTNRLKSRWLIEIDPKTLDRRIIAGWWMRTAQSDSYLNPTVVGEGLVDHIRR